METTPTVVPGAVMPGAALTTAASNTFYSMPARVVLTRVFLFCSGRPASDFAPDVSGCCCLSVHLLILSEIQLDVPMGDTLAPEWVYIPLAGPSSDPRGFAVHPMLTPL